jgi:hypothetical protein
MNLFKTYSYTWKQIGVFKVALLAIGILIGSYAHEFFNSNMIFVAVIALLATTYIMYVSFKQ